jgi:hypothetical protein
MRRIFPSLFLVILCELVSGFHNHAKTPVKNLYSPPSDTLIESTIMDKLFELPEVKRKWKFVDSLTGHKKGISMRVMKRPEGVSNYYWIAVGYDSDLKFETYYNFYVWPDQMTIRYFDTVDGKILTLAEWRKKLTPAKKRSPVKKRSPAKKSALHR